MCIAPKLSIPQSYISNSEQGRQNGQGFNEVALNYTIVMDNAPGPNILNQSLSLSLRGDPVFLEIDRNNKQYEVFSGSTISITVGSSK